MSGYLGYTYSMEHYNNYDMHELSKPHTLLRPCAHVGCQVLVASGYCDKHRPRSSIRHDAPRDWHRLYDTKRWDKLRAAQLLREPFCRACAAAGVRTRATDVDHVTPHRGNIVLFFDSGNLQSLCHACHSRKTIREQQAGEGDRPHKL